MIVVAAGTPKSGSGWFYNWTNDLLVAAGYDDAREIRDRHGLKNLLRAANCNLRKPDAATLGPLDKLAQENDYTFVVKTHRGPAPALLRLKDAGRLKAMYIYRDLRDVMVSALERGETMRTNGELKGRHWGIGPQRSFAKYHTVKGAIRWIRWRVMPIWRAYTNTDGVLVTRYEDMKTNPMVEIKRIAAHLEIDVPETTMQEIIDRYDRSKAMGDHISGLHFNKGVTGRFKEKMTEQEQALCARKLSRDLQKMGYDE